MSASFANAYLRLPTVEAVSYLIWQDQRTPSRKEALANPLSSIVNIIISSSRGRRKPLQIPSRTPSLT